MDGGVFCRFGYIHPDYNRSGRRGRGSGSRVIEVRFGMRSGCCLVAIVVGRSNCFVRGFCLKGRCFDLSMKGLDTINRRRQSYIEHTSIVACSSAEVAHL